MPISAIEILVSNLERRGLRHGEKRVAPRLCDHPACLPAITGKVEMVYEGEQQGAEVVAKRLIGTAVKKLFDARFPAPDSGRPTQRRREELEDVGEDSPAVRRALCMSKPAAAAACGLCQRSAAVRSLASRRSASAPTT